MPLTISVVGQKGGVGKTSLATSLFAHVVSEKIPAGILDLDAQGNATVWAVGHQTFQAVRQHAGAEAFTLPHGDIAKHLAGRPNASTVAGRTLVDMVAEHVTPCAKLGGGHVAPANVYMAPHAFTELRLDALPFDVVIVDTPPRLSSVLLRNIAAQSDAIVAPIQLEPYAVQNIADLVNEISYGGPHLLDTGALRLVVTMRQRIAIHDYHATVVRKQWRKYLSPVEISRATVWAEMAIHGHAWKPNSAPAKAGAELWADISKTLKRRKVA